MKLFLVISLVALWQTSNGKYVNEEYEPEEIQDQVFEVSLLNNNFKTLFCKYAGVVNILFIRDRQSYCFVRDPQIAESEDRPVRIDPRFSKIC